MCTVLPKRNFIPIISLRNKEPLNVLKDSKFILNDQGGHSDSFRINVESFSAFRDPLFLKQIPGRELLFESMVHTTCSNRISKEV